MFHVKHILSIIKNKPIHELFFYLFLFLLPFQTRILFHAERAYIDWYFDYHQAIFVYLSDLVLLVCFTSWLLFHKKPPPPNLPLKGGGIKIFWLILALFGVILASLFLVKRLDLGIYQTIKWLELLGLILYIRTTFVSVKPFHRIFLIIFISAVLQAGLGIVQFHMQHDLDLSFLGEYIAPAGTPGLATIDVSDEKLIRAYGTMPHPNVLAGFLIFGLISGLFWLCNFPLVPSPFGRKGRGEGILKILLVSCGIFIILLGIFLSFSRISWISAILVISLFLIFHVKRLIFPSLYGGKVRREGVKNAIIVGLLLVSCGTILIGYQNLLVSRTTESFSSNAIAYRAQYNQMGLEIIKKHPLLGVGVGNYNIVSQETFLSTEALAKADDLEPWQYQPPHNIFIFLAAELGLLGLVIFLGIVWLIIRAAIWIPDQIRNDASSFILLRFTLLLAIFIFLFIGLFDHYFLTIQQGRLAFFTALGLLAALGQKNTAALLQDKPWTNDGGIRALDL